MTRTIIFEGIASSGKTTLEDMLARELSVNKSVEIIGEEETLAPLFENRAVEVARAHLLSFFPRLDTSVMDYIIIDRFHFSHAFRTHSTIENFRDVEDWLRIYQPIVFLLTIKEENILSRIEETTTRRGSSWARGKQGTLQERAAYYGDQQRTLIQFASKSSLSVVQIDTSMKNWSQNLEEIRNAL